MEDVEAEYRHDYQCDVWVHLKDGVQGDSYRRLHQIQVTCHLDASCDGPFEAEEFQ